MLQEQVYTVYGELLRGELITAMGCTEPIAIAYAGALARQILGREPDTLQLACSGNIVKNVKGVTVPNSGGRRGIEIAALLGLPLPTVLSKYSRALKKLQLAWKEAD